jgi:hypothetical protein
MCGIRLPCFTHEPLSGGSTSRRFGDRHPLGNLIFSFFLHKNEKIRVILPRKPFFLHDRHPLTDFLDPPLCFFYFASTVYNYKKNANGKVCIHIKAKKYG